MGIFSGIASLFGHEAVEVGTHAVEGEVEHAVTQTAEGGAMTMVKSEEKGVTRYIPKWVKGNPLKTALGGAFAGYEIYEHTVGGSEEEQRDPVSGFAYAMCKAATIGQSDCEWTEYVGPVLLGFVVMNVVPVDGFSYKLALGIGSGAAFYIYKKDLLKLG